MYLGFIRYNKGLSSVIEESVEMALEGSGHKYKFFDVEDIGRIDADYVFWMDSIYDPQGLLEVVEYMSSIPNVDIFYPWFYAPWGGNGSRIRNVSLGIRDSCPVGVIFRGSMMRGQIYNGDFNKICLELSGMTVDTCFIDNTRPIATAITVPLPVHTTRSVKRGTLEDKMIIFSMLRGIKNINGRTWYLIDNQLEFIRRSILTTLNRDKKTIGPWLYEKLYNKIKPE